MKPSLRLISRMPSARSTLIAVALVPAALLLGACGSNDDSKQELTSATASSLRSKLDQVQQSVASRDCSGAATQATALRQQVQDLPSRVDGKLRDALDSSARRLETLVADQCEPDTTTDQPAVGTTSESTPQPENQTPDKAKDKKPKKQKEPKPGKDEPPADTGGATGGSGAVSPGGE
jgi:hypothetical protein